MHNSNPPELQPGEFHPMAPSAFQFVKKQGVERLLLMSEALASTALSNSAGSRLAAICHGTLDRILNGQPVSDRYVLGLAWLIISNQRNVEMDEVAQGRDGGSSPRADVGDSRPASGARAPFAPPPASAPERETPPDPVDKDVHI